MSSHKPWCASVPRPFDNFIGQGPLRCDCGAVTPEDQERIRNHCTLVPTDKLKAMQERASEAERLLREAERAMVDLGACRDQGCQCGSLLVQIRAFLSGSAQPKEGRG